MTASVWSTNALSQHALKMRIASLIPWLRRQRDSFLILLILADSCYPGAGLNPLCIVSPLDGNTELIFPRHVAPLCSLDYLDSASWQHGFAPALSFRRSCNQYKIKIPLFIPHAKILLRSRATVHYHIIIVQSCSLGGMDECLNLLVSDP